MSFSKLDGKWILEADDGGEFEYDAALRRWIPAVGFILFYYFIFLKLGSN